MPKEITIPQEEVCPKCKCLNFEFNRFTGECACHECDHNWKYQSDSAACSLKTVTISPNGQRREMTYPVTETELSIMCDGSRRQRKSIVDHIRKNTNFKTENV